MPREDSNLERGNLRDAAATLGRMTYYPATVVAVTPESATVRLETSGHEIRLAHGAANRVPEDLRAVGKTGFVSFPKAPPVFTPEER